MVRIIMGLKGSGKTKQIIDLAREALETEKGNVVCIERGHKFKFDVGHAARLIDISDYDCTDFQWLKGFISGLYSGNYDISHIFLDSLYKIACCDDKDAAEDFASWLENFGALNDVSFTVTISAAVEDASETIEKYLIPNRI